MNVLDSRFLRLGDCFARRFSTPGTVKYGLTVAAGIPLPAPEHNYTVTIRPKGSNKATQHNVIVRARNSRLSAEPENIEIEAGDAVLWHTPDPGTPGFVVTCVQSEQKFSSSALHGDALYSHAFGVPGSYEWVDANGGLVKGEIVVSNPESGRAEHHEKWLKALSKGLSIRIAGTKVEPQKLEVIVGQTVFWIVEKADGISITDARLIRRPAAPAKKR
jgi:plastocyanin